MKTSNGSPRRRLTHSDATRRTRLLTAFDRSGQSAAAFARPHGLTYSTFCGWRQRRDRAKTSPAFVQVEVASPAAPVELVIELDPQARMRIHSESQMALAARLFQSLNADSLQERVIPNLHNEPPNQHRD